MGSHDLGLLEVVESVNGVIHALVDVSNVESRFDVFRVKLEGLFVVDQSILVVAIVVESTRQVEVAL